MSQIIKFKSIIYQNEEKNNEIKFASKLQRSRFGEFDVLEFTEPSKNVMNRIEISLTDINIFAGPSSINLKLKTKLPIQYQTSEGLLILDSYMEFLNYAENKMDFKYSLSYQEHPIGIYHIFLEVK